MKSKVKKTKVGQGFLAGLEDVLKWSRGQIELRTKEVEIPERPPVLIGKIGSTKPRL